MILSDRDIKFRLAGRGLSIEPYNPDNVEPCSYDMTLQRIDLLSSPRWGGYGSGFWELDPGQFALASTLEYIRIPDDLCGFVHGKSTWGRRGLIIETAGVVDAGFEGQLTLELVNVSAQPIILKPGVRICQLVLHKMLSPAEFPYGHSSRKSKYQKQTGVTGPREKP